MFSSQPRQVVNVSAEGGFKQTGGSMGMEGMAQSLLQHIHCKDGGSKQSLERTCCA